MRVILGFHYPPDFPFHVYLEDHVQALIHCVRSNGWSVSHGDHDVTIALGLHTLRTAVADPGSIVLNTERTSPFVHGLLADYIDRLRPARAIWSLFEDDTAFLRESGLNAFTWQYGPDVFPQVVPPNAHREADLFFIGSMSPHRESRVLALRRAGLRVAGAASMSWLTKCHQIGATRAMLALAFDDTANYLPWTRVVFARAQGVPSVSDVPARGAWGERWCHCPPADDRDWLAFVRGVLAHAGALQSFETDSHVVFRSLFEKSMGRQVLPQLSTALSTSL